MNKKKVMSLFVMSALMVSLFAGCGSRQDKKQVKLNPDEPVSLTVWHYYNGAQQAAFDELVSEFNATVGKDEGIYVEGYSQGSVTDLEQAVKDAFEGKVGAETLPDIFSSYADSAYAIQQEGMLADLTQYFSDEELSEYVDAYVEEGYFNNDGALYLFPVAKSTEIMMINTTDWQPFADETGYTFDDLKTIEDVIEVAKSYYEWTDAKTKDIPDDGKAFYGRDSMSNYFVINLKQLGDEIFDVQDGKVTVHVQKEKIRRLWDDYYVPYVNGYFASYGKFRSDDVKTGDILAYTGSSSSSMYFPDAVMTDDETKDIDFAVLPVPKMAGGDDVNVQQGAGMAVTKSDEMHEYAASEFLKWFTKKENNLRFVCESAYLPVKKEANTIDALDEVIADNQIDINDKAYACLKSILDEFDTTTFYTTKCFPNAFAARKVLDYNLSDQAAADKAAIDEKVAAGADRAETIAQYTDDAAFENWYEQFCEALDQEISQ